MVWSSDSARQFRRDAPLAPLTWYRLGGPARYLMTPRSIDDLVAARRFARENELPFRVLGRGANVLVRDEGVPGVVVHVHKGVFAKVRIDGTCVTAGAGVDLMRLCRACCCKGLAGLETLAGIPATLGGAVAMNAGGRFGQISDVVRRVTVVDETGREAVRGVSELAFGYRRANLGTDIVVQVELELRPADAGELLRRHDDIWELKRASQPYGERSAGCVFRNPPGQSAGALIDRAGLKGMCCGGARVSDVHANFIVTRGDARSSDVMRLADAVRGRVRDRFGVDLEMEMVIW
ncbi:MAG: UDP-N-acetylmuramate dehydrogenase [Phycisphaerales bacterium]|nr:MAG: UDP-N-acetylmuramate dehydrogenase [Phycisphaerales bacterium]